MGRAHDCALCGGVSDAVVCAACAAALPRAGFPCPRCAIPMPVAAPACGRCLRRPPPFDEARAAFEYRFPVNRLVMRFKFGGDLATGRWLGEQLAARVAGDPRPDVLVVPPMDRAGLRRRGFNQALELAKAVRAALGLRLERSAFAKVRSTGAQAGLGARARRANLRGAFACAHAFDGLHVAVVDDVVTTGATADALARLARLAGAARVTVWAVARTPDPRR